MPKHSIAFVRLNSLVGSLSIQTKTPSNECTLGILPYLQVRFPTLQLSIERYNHDGDLALIANAEQTSLSIARLDQYVDFLNSITHISWVKRLQNRFRKPRPHIEVLVVETDLADIMSWLLENCKQDEYKVITRYHNSIMVCLTPEKALRFKLWYPLK